VALVTQKIQLSDNFLKPEVVGKRKPLQFEYLPGTYVSSLFLCSMMMIADSLTLFIKEMDGIAQLPA